MLTSAIKYTLLPFYYAQQFLPQKKKSFEELLEEIKVDFSEWDCHLLDIITPEGVVVIRTLDEKIAKVEIVLETHPGQFLDKQEYLDKLISFREEKILKYQRKESV